MLATFFNSWIKRPTFPADTDVFRTSSGCLNKVTTSYDQTRRIQDVWQKTSNLWRLEDALFTSPWRCPIYNVLKTSFYDVLKTSYLRRLENVRFTSSWKRLIYNVLNTSVLRGLEDVGFTSSWKRPIYNVFKTSDLWRLGDVWFTTSWRRLIYDFLMTYVKRRLWRKQRLHNVKMNYFFSFCIVWNIEKILSVPLRLVLRYEIL